MERVSSKRSRMFLRFQRQCSVSNTWGAFAKLLFRWEASIYKLIWPEFFFFAFVYFVLSATYRWFINMEQKENFEKVVKYCREFEDLTSLSLILGFYVTTAINRWWTQYQLLPWPDDLALLISSAFIGRERRDYILKRTFMRYIILCYTLTMSLISPQIKKRFPTLQHIVDAGLMTEEESLTYQSLSEKIKGTKQWMPLMWAVGVITEARREERLTDDHIKQQILDGVVSYRQRCQSLIGYDRYGIPLVFTQVVSLAVYCYFLGAAMGRQFVSTDDIDLWVPWFTLLQFFFFFGWLKVAETLISPFGEDDQDFEMKELLDRHLQMSMAIIEEYESLPRFGEDKFWHEKIPSELPYTLASKKDHMPYVGSAANLDIPLEEQQIVNFHQREEEEPCLPIKKENEQPPPRVSKKLATFISHFKVQYAHREPEKMQVLLDNERGHSSSPKITNQTKNTDV